MVPHRLTLELMKHDETTSAPKRDYDATASELDSSRLAPAVGVIRLGRESYSNHGRPLTRNPGPPFYHATGLL